MTWAVIIGLILQILGPILQDILKKLLERWLSRAAESVPLPTGEEDLSGRLDDLFNAAIRAQPYFRFGRRALLRTAKRIALARADAIGAVASGNNAPLPVLTADEVDDLAEGTTAITTELVGE